MTAKIIDGKKIALRIRAGIRSELLMLAKCAHHSKPMLAVVSVGNNSASEIYALSQKALFLDLGIGYRPVVLPGTSSEKNIIKTIKKLNNDTSVTGIMLQMPLPKTINSQKIRLAIKPEKDAEGITPHNLGMLAYSGAQLSVAPCTASAVMECIKSTGATIKGKEAVIVGHSEIVGKPLCLMMLSSALSSATPTVCHIATKNLKNHTKRAEILIAAVGIPNFIRKDMVKKGAIVIDVGINRLKNKITGDVDFAGVKKTAGYITPVPGGVGAVTTAILARNLISLYKSQTVRVDKK